MEVFKQRKKKRIFLPIVAFALCIMLIVLWNDSKEVNKKEVAALAEAFEGLSACIELILDGEEVEYGELDKLYTEVYLKYTECRILLEKNNDYSLQNYLVSFYRKLEPMYYSLVNITYIDRLNPAHLRDEFSDIRESFDLFVSEYEFYIK